jgi:hypothetical protein
MLGSRLLIGASVEERLQDENGGNLVDDSLALATCGVSACVEMAVGLGGREALVPKMHGEAELGAEVFGEGLGFGGLRTLVAGHVKRIADDCFCYVVLAQDTGDGLQVRAAGGAVQGEQRLRGVAQRVGDGDADAPVAYVEGDDAADQGAGLVFRGIGFSGVRVWPRGIVIHQPSVEHGLS